MRIDGSWRLCEDGIVRPVIRAEARTAAGKWLPFDMLVDIGADRTVFSAAHFQALGFAPTPAKERLEGVGGHAESVVFGTEIRMIRETGLPIIFEGQFAAFTDPKALDMNVLGRDLTNLFAVIVDRPQDVVCLLGGNHRYVVVDK